MPKKSKIQFYHIDSSFLPRVKEILKDKEGETFDADSVTEALIQKHKEYARKPLPALKNLVEKALANIIRKDDDMMMSVDTDEHNDRVEQRLREEGAYAPHPGSDDDASTQKKKPNAMNKFLSGMYKASQKPGTSTDTQPAADAQSTPAPDSSDEASKEIVDLSLEDEASKTPSKSNKPEYTAVKLPDKPAPTTSKPAPTTNKPAPTSNPNGTKAKTPSSAPRPEPAKQTRSNVQQASTPSASKRQRSTEEASTTPSSAQPPKKLRKNNAGLVPEGPESEQNFTIPTSSFADVGGIEHVLQDIREHIEYPLLHPEIYSHIGVGPPRGILLCGPPGSGKTLMANAIAGELQVPFFNISAPEVVSGMSGESESKIRSLFNDAMMNAPAILFIDEIDAITPKRENAQREMEKRIVAQLLTCMDSLENNPIGTVIVIGATNRPDALDSALRRAGRFDKEITLGVPDLAARSRILKVLSRKMKLAGDFDFDEIAQKTPGFVGADLSALTKEAAVLTINRIFHSLEEQSVASAADTEKMSVDIKTPGAAENEELERRSRASARLRSFSQPLTKEQLEPLCVTMDDFVQAIKKVQPSSKREGFATIPNVSWSDVGALTSIREELGLSILQPIKNPMRYRNMGLNPSAGVCLYGPPGCGKTLLAKAIAFECQANFISIKGPELLNKYVGESERAVRQVFQRAAASSPCVVFFDELDALAPRRSGDESNEASKRVVNQLLTEMDGLDRRNEVFVIAATNRPDMIDPAMLRPGRLDKCLYVPLPDKEDRADILKTLTKRTPIKPDVDVIAIAYDQRCEGFSGADLAHLVKEAAIYALSTAPVEEQYVTVGMEHFQKAFTKVSPSVSKKDARLYKMMQRSLPGPLSQATAQTGTAKIEEITGNQFEDSNGPSNDTTTTNHNNTTENPSTSTKSDTPALVT
eukprot:Phypoly_transcript_02259.p1 GENE.Phypoly_transcript_02259~~Phypoly_transcript_02259.p1  ORF type:complete len:929 (+),score=161.80 Phypoly_transcript_02259:105-2891(+)